MEENKNILDELKKRQKPQVPQGFFENFYEELMAKIAEKESGLDAFQKTTKPDVPTGFFENFAENITQQTSEQEPIEQANPTKIFTLRVVGIVSAAAACLLVMFLLAPPTTDDQMADELRGVPPKEEAISDEDLLAYVDENDIIDFILEEEISVEDAESTIEETTTETETEEAVDQLDDLDEEDILYYLEDDLDDINLDDLEL